MTLSEPRSSIDALLEHEPFLRNLAWNLTRDHASADDLVQETWIVALRRSPGALGKPRRWLAKVVRNLASEQRRGRRRRDTREREREPRRGVQTPPDVHETRRLRARLGDSLDRLRTEDRTLIEMRCADGLPPREIAARTGLPVKVVYDRLKRNLATLRRDLDDEYGDRKQWGALLLTLGGLEQPLPRAPLSPLGSSAVWVWPLAAALLALGWAGLGAWSELHAAAPPVSELDAIHSGGAPIASIEPVGSGRRALAPLADTLSENVASAGEGTLLVEAFWNVPRERAGGIALLCERDDTASPSDEHFETLTASDGSARFEGLAPGKWRVSPLVGRARRFEVGAQGTTRGELILRRAAAFDLAVVDEAGAPLAGAALEVSWPTRLDAWRPLGRTDARGQLIAAQLDRGSWVRVATESGTSDAYALALVERHTRSLTLTLPAPSAGLEVRARDGSGAPLVGLRLGLAFGPQSWIDAHGALRQRGAPRWLETDSSGRLVFRCTPASERRLYVDSPGTARVVLPVAELASTLELVLERPASLSGVVTTAAGAPAAFARVRASGESIGLEALETRADGYGHFSLEQIASGEVRLEAISNKPRAVGYSTRIVQLHPGAHLEWSPTLGAAPEISGRALDARGLPVAGAEIRVERSSRAAACLDADVARSRSGSTRVQTDAQGYFHVNVFADEPFVVTWLETPAVPRALDWREGVRAGEPPLELRATHDRAASASLLGTLRDESGAPLKDAEVHVHGPLLLRALRVQVDPATGAFHLPRLNPSWYRVRVWRPGAPPVELDGGARLELAPGEARSLGDLVVGEKLARPY